MLVYMYMPRGVYKHKTHSLERKKKIGHSVSILWTVIRKGKTHEEIFGKKTALLMRQKMSKAKLGRKMPWNKGYQKEKHPRWIKDRTKIKGRHTRSFHDPCYRQWRSDVFKRDKSQCRLRNSSCEGKLESHHIKPWQTHPRLRYQITNGITLCHAHHPRKRAEEKRLISIFTKLIRN